jgi:pyridoxine 5-phosphate synthase
MKKTSHRLGINVDHVATLRQARGIGWPDPVEAALICQKAGADSIVVHLREDRRHIQDQDLIRLKAVLKIRLNIESSINPGVLRTVQRVRPDCITLVPERRQERTTESGLDVKGQQGKITRIIRNLRCKRIAVSCFVDSRPEQIKASWAAGAEAVEIHTGAYSIQKNSKKRESLAKEIGESILCAKAFGLHAHVGHGLDYVNAHRIAQLPGICEFNIGYSVICESLKIGLLQAVRNMKRLIQ